MESRIDTTLDQPTPSTTPKVRQPWILALTLLLSGAYFLIFLIQRQTHWPPWLSSWNAQARITITGQLNDLLSGMGMPSPIHYLWRHAFYLTLMAGVVPYLCMALMWRPRLYDLGFRKPNLVGIRMCLVGYVLSIPLLWWMIQSPTFKGSYLAQWNSAGSVTFFSYYLINMLWEHFLLQGVLLALFRSGRRWPGPPIFHQEASSLSIRALRWIGMAQPVGHQKGAAKILSWLGLQPGCLVAVLGSGLLFAGLHLGKDPRELLLSLPGGIALAYLAYHSNTWLMPFFLHLATAGTVLLLIM